MRRVYLKHLVCVAWQRTMHDVIGQTLGQRIARTVVALCAIGVPYLYVRWINHSSQAFSDAVRGWLFATAAILTAAFFAFAYHLLIEGPYQLWKEQDGRLHPNAEFDTEWDRLTAPERPSSDPPFIAALKRDWTERTYQTMVKARELKSDTSLSEALGYVAFGEWGKAYSDAILAGNVAHSEITAQFRQKAFDGDLTVWGKHSESRLFEPIPKDHWRDHSITLTDLVSPALSGGAEPYRELMLNRREVEKVWPHER